MAISLDELYRKTRYEIYSLRTSLIIGEANPVVDAFLKRHGPDCYAFLTAWNPFSRQLTEPENRARNQRLAADLAPWPFLLGTSHDLEGWPGEEGFFVLGLDRAQAVRLAARYEQHAVVAGTRGAPVELLYADAMAALRCRARPVD